MAVGEAPHFLKPKRRLRTAPAGRWANAFVQATDLGLLCALFAVPFLMGGRQPLGQLVLSLAACWVALAWGLHVLVNPRAGWIGTRAEWLLLAAAGLVFLQCVHLPADVVHTVSPRAARFLPLWNASADGSPLLGNWTHLSFTPAETKAALVTFLAYALLFVVTAQRLRHLNDVERLLRWVAMAAAGMAAFGLVQYVAGNGKFFWIYEHPFTGTNDAPKGSFTNRNHFAQFLALGVGPLIWWVLRLLEAGRTRTSTQFGRPAGGRGELAVGIVGTGLGVVAFAGLLSLSRGGTAALCAAGFTCLLILYRSRLVSGKLVGGLGCAGALLCSFLFIYGYDAVSKRLEYWEAPNRWLIWKANLQMMADFPVAGTGVGSHAEVYPVYLDLPHFHKEFTHAENSFLQVGSETGLVGLGLAVLGAAICLAWCVRAVWRNTDPRVAAALAAVTAGLVANVVHAVGDFVWYVPGCMVVVALLAAAACRLFQLTRPTTAGDNPVPAPAAMPAAFRWALLGGVACLAAWMVQVQWPAVAAESHWQRYLTLAVNSDRSEDDMSDGDELELLKRKLTALTAAAKANPNDHRVQWRAAQGYLALFHRLQQESPNRMSLLQIRDAARHSKFASPDELHAWLERAIGQHHELLPAALKHSRRAVELCPLQGPAYLALSRLDFLEQPRTDSTLRYVAQAESVRPFDAQVLFAVGREAWMAGNYEVAVDKWKQAFGRDRRYERQIIELLAPFVPAATFIADFQPDCSALGALAERYRMLGRTEDYRIAQRHHAEALFELAGTLAHREQLRTLLAAHAAFDELGEVELAEKCLIAACEANPNSFRVRSAYGLWAVKRELWPQAAEHLKWCLDQRPTDRNLRRLAAQAQERKLLLARPPSAAAKRH